MAFSAVITSSHYVCLPKATRPSLRRTVRCCATSISPKFDLKTYWTALIKEIDQKLDEAISVQYPKQIYEAMRYSVLAKGAKRAPPVMCVAACELFGGDRLAAFPTACALEMVCLFFHCCSQVFCFFVLLFALVFIFFLFFFFMISYVLNLGSFQYLDCVL